MPPASDAMALPALPAPIFRLIIAFALFDSDSDLLERPPRTARWLLAALRDLAVVAKSWTAPIRDVFALCKLSKLTIELQRATRTELATHRRNAVLRGPYVRELTIAMGQYSHDNAFFHIHTALHFVDDAALPWRELFRYMPDLRRLDMSKMPLSSPHTIAVLREASTYCPGVQSLLLPAKQSASDDFRGNESDAYMAAVAAALARWRVKGGLRQLSFPSRRDGDLCAESTSYLALISDLCPHIEHLDSHKHSLREIDRLTTTEQWLVDLPAWTQFNAECTHLRVFNWLVAPFKDDFFQVFGRHTKPQLTHLTFAVNMLWRWPTYFTAIGDTAAAQSRNYGVAARRPETALQACPALRDLEVCLYHPVDDDVLDDPMAMHEATDYDFLVDTWPQTEVMDLNVFGDAFCQAVATYCPLLERVSIWEVAEQYNGNTIEPIQSLTDIGLGALAKLAWLQFLELRAVNCTGRGLFALLNDAPTVCSAQRDLQIAVGGATPTHERAFYIVVLQLLTTLSKTDALAFATRKVTLRVVNAAVGAVDFDWSKRYMKKLKKLIAIVKRKHPLVQLRCGIHGKHRKGFASLTELGLFTTVATPSAWNGWDDDDGGRRAPTDVFMDRGGSVATTSVRGTERASYGPYGRTFQFDELADGGSDDHAYPLDLEGDARAYMLDHLPIDFEPDDDFLDAYGGYGYGGDYYGDEFGYGGDYDDDDVDDVDYEL